MHSQEERQGKRLIFFCVLVSLQRGLLCSPTLVSAALAGWMQLVPNLVPDPSCPLLLDIRWPEFLCGELLCFALAGGIGSVLAPEGYQMHAFRSWRES